MWRVKTGVTVTYGQDSSSSHEGPDTVEIDYGCSEDERWDSTHGANCIRHASPVGYIYLARAIERVRYPRLTRLFTIMNQISLINEVDPRVQIW